MPGMSGPATVDSLLQLDHSLRVLYMSGYTGDAITGGPGLDSGMPFIQKPFTPAGLICKIRGILDNRGAAPPAESPTHPSSVHFQSLPQIPRANSKARYIFS
jgi:DNA-binding response OmpR family regulator